MSSPNTPFLLPTRCDAPSLSISRNSLSHPSRAGKGLIDGTKTNANRTAMYPSAKAIVAFDPSHDTPQRGRIYFQITHVRVDIHTGHDIGGIIVMSAAPGPTDMNNRVAQISSGCIFFLLYCLPLFSSFLLLSQTALTIASPPLLLLLSKSYPVKSL